MLFIAFPKLVRYSPESDNQLNEVNFQMKAYSLDLRQKIIDVYSEGHISQRQLAKQFHVALSFIQKLLKQYREKGNIAPLVRIQQTPTKLDSKQLEVLQELVNTNKDATLEELRYKLEQETGVLISRSTVDRMLCRLNLTLKKNTTGDGKRNRKSTKRTIRVLGNSQENLGKRSDFSR